MQVALPLAQESAGGFPVAALVFAAGLAVVHLVSGRVWSAGRGRRRRFLSSAGGASVAYVFVLLLPEISEAAVSYGEARDTALFVEQTVYVFVLLGFVVFYATEVFVARNVGEDVETSLLVFRAHVGAFATYSALIGYLLFHQEVSGVVNLFFYAAAMALHFAVTDYGMYRHHGAEYDRVGRWVLAGATLVGAGVGLFVDVSPLVLWTLFGFVSGGVVFNVIKEELPEAKEGLVLPFVAGALAYTVLVVLI
jgi:hypothetical protein